MNTLIKSSLSIFISSVLTVINISSVNATEISTISKENTQNFLTQSLHNELSQITSIINLDLQQDIRFSVENEQQLAGNIVSSEQSNDEQHNDQINSSISE